VDCGIPRTTYYFTVFVDYWQEALPRPANSVQRKKIKRISDKQLTNKLDDVFRNIMRAKQLRKGHFRCFVCGMDAHQFSNHKEPGLQVGHFISRSVRPLRWDFDNCEMVCSSCNIIHENNTLPHTVAILREYGEERVQSLNTTWQLSRQVGKSFTRTQKLERLEELEEILEDLTNTNC
jgi:5-methylcytosine-specific restriction endonuclease McrA